MFSLYMRRRGRCSQNNDRRPTEHETVRLVSQSHNIPLTLPLAFPSRIELRTYKEDFFSGLTPLYSFSSPQTRRLRYQGIRATAARVCRVHVRNIDLAAAILNEGRKSSNPRVAKRNPASPHLRGVSHYGNKIHRITATELKTTKKKNIQLQVAKFFAFLTNFWPIPFPISTSTHSANIVV